MLSKAPPCLKGSPQRRALLGGELGRGILHPPCHRRDERPSSAPKLKNV